MTRHAAFAGLDASHVVAVTGHRPPKVGGYAAGNPLEQAVRKALRTALVNLRDLRRLQGDPEGKLCALTGMALGVDQWFAEAAIDLGIPFVAAVPFEGQELRWPSTSQIAYHTTLAEARAVHMVCPGGYAAWKMQARNRWMVDNADQCIAVWDGSEGGTGNCVEYARSRALPVEIIDPRTLKLE